MTVLDADFTVLNLSPNDPYIDNLNGRDFLSMYKEKMENKEKQNMKFSV